MIHMITITFSRESYCNGSDMGIVIERIHMYSYVRSNLSGSVTLQHKKIPAPSNVSGNRVPSYNGAGYILEWVGSGNRHAQSLGGAASWADH